MTIKMTKEVNAEELSVTFKADDEHVLTCQLTDLNEDMIARFALHGISQQIGDLYAGLPKKAAAAEMKPIDWIKAVLPETWDLRIAGDWSKKREGFERIADLVTALSEVTGKDPATIKEGLEDRTKEEKAALRQVKAVKAVLLRLKAERATAAAEGFEPEATEEDAAILEGFMS